MLSGTTWIEKIIFVVPAVPTKKNIAVSDIIRGSQGASCVIRTFSILVEFSLMLGTWH
jgi:hypothetical protein